MEQRLSCLQASCIHPYQVISKLKINMQSLMGLGWDTASESHQFAPAHLPEGAPVKQLQPALPAGPVRWPQ